MRLLLLALISIVSLRSSSGQTGPTGLLVMAHGGSPEWNGTVHEAVGPLRNEMPVAVAFGMADPRTMETAVDSLLAQNVSRIRIVRVFLSGDSFLESTGYVLGLHDRKPHAGMHAEHMRQLRIPVPVSVSAEGLLDAPEVGGILRRRVQALSTVPGDECVLLIAHGAGSEEENDTWLQRMDRLADSVRASAPFAAVRVETLREDWEGPRGAAEARIRGFVEAENAAGREVIVVPFRLSGFGPYAEVLEGLEYRHDGTGLLPDHAITEWIRRQAALGPGATSPWPRQGGSR